MSPNPISWEVLQWAADECERQRSGEQSVVWMLRGWNYAMGMPEITRASLLALARIVEPRKNDGSGFRQVGVRVGFNVKMPWQQVDRAIDNLLTVDALRMNPDEWFREYEEIHPLRDGNGRTGSILWNWLRGTLSSEEGPEAPPDYWCNPIDADDIADAICCMGDARRERHREDQRTEPR